VAWLRVLDGAAKGTAEEAATLIARYVDDDRWQRFRRDLLESVRKRYLDDSKIDWQEWLYLKERANELLKDDKDTAADWVVKLCREVSGDPAWSPPRDTTSVDAEKTAEETRAAERNAREAQAILESENADWPTSGDASPTRSTSSRSRHRRSRSARMSSRVPRPSRRRSPAEGSCRRPLPARHHRRSARQCARYSARPPHRRSGGNSCSSDSRLGLAQARAPLANESPPETVRLACSPPAAREARRRELGKTLESTIGAIRPASAATPAASPVAACLPKKGD